LISVPRLALVKGRGRTPEGGPLTARFYLMLSVGGALGAVLVAIVAPLTLDGYFELNITLRLLPLLPVLATRGFWSALTLVPTAYFAYSGARDYAAGVRTMERDFYGAVRTRDRTAGGFTYRSTYRGGIIHGGQLQGGQYRNVASDYFGPGPGNGRLSTAMNELRPLPRSLGIVGLGAGVVVAYGRAGDRTSCSTGSARAWWRSSAASSASCAVRPLGWCPWSWATAVCRWSANCARGGGCKYDVLGIDAFAGDSIPMHLITRGALQPYLQHIQPDGVIEFQATNRYIDLMSVIKRHAGELGLHAVLVPDVPESSDGTSYRLSSTDQVLVTRDKRLLEHPRIREAASEISDRAGLPTFTDSHHNLVRILKWRRVGPGHRRALPHGHRPGAAIVRTRACANGAPRTASFDAWGVHLSAAGSMSAR
jgi:hypothetical protein